MAGLAIKISDKISDHDAATIEPLAVGLNAWRTAQVEPGASVLIIGAGVIGLALAKWARFFGAGDIAVSEMVPARLERARQMGVELLIDAAKDANPVAEFERITGRKPAVIFECVGRPMIDKLIAMAPSHTQLVMVGTGMQPENFTVVSARDEAPEDDVPVRLCADRLPFRAAHDDRRTHGSRRAGNCHGRAR